MKTKSQTLPAVLHERSSQAHADTEKFICLNSFGFTQIFLLALVIIVSAACVPKNAPVTASSSSEKSGPIYAGFTGATAANTTGPQKVQILWTLSADPSVTGYNVYDTTLRTSPKLIKTLTAGTSQVSITGLGNQSYYSFRVRATTKLGVEDGNTNDVLAIPYGGVTGSLSLSSSTAQITFNDASNSDQVSVFCQVGSSTDWKPMATVTDITQTQVRLSGLQAGVSYTCRAAVVVNGFTDNNTVTTTFTPVGTATNLQFTTQPGSAASGSSLGPQPVVTIKDVNGTVVAAGPDSTATITLTISSSSPTPGTVRGTATVTAVRGVATFTGLNLQESGIKILTATKSDTSSQAMGSGALTADSNQFTISAGSVSATRSSITISPSVPPNSALIANGSNSYTITITLLDQYGNPVVGTRPTFASNISGDTIVQPSVNTNASGVTTGSISTTIADTSPARSLSISSPSGLSGVTVLAPFVPGPAAKLAFTTQPVNSPAGVLSMATVRVAVQDAQSNTITTGAAATSAIGMAIAANTSGATLSGTFPAAAVAGIATFQDLGISKTQTGYKLLATSGSLSPAYSNSFNITSGIPQKVVINGPTTFSSGACSSAFTIQLQDLGNNPANAIQNTPVTISGIGGALMYSSSTCGGTALSTNMTFTAGTNTKTVYIKDVKAESLSMLASDPSNVLGAGSYAIKVSPDKIYILANAPSPAAPGTPLSVVAGKCSPPIVITPAGDDTNPGPLFAITTVTITGIPVSATLYSDSTCLIPIVATNVQLSPATGSNYTTNLYLKDPKAETFNISIADSLGQLTTMSALQSISVLASDITFTGPSTVVSGACSSAFTVTLKDTLGTSVAAPVNTSLSMIGLGSSTGHFYTSPSCAGSPLGSTITIPQNSALLQIYFKDNAAESLTLHLTDPAGNMNDSPSLNLGISPSALKITGPAPTTTTTSKTSVCAGPFVVNTIDGANNVTAAISPVTANLTGSGTGGGFFGDSACTGAVTQLVFAQGVNNQSFYFQGQYPAASLTFTAADANSVLSSGTINWTVTAAPGFLGTAGSMADSNNNLYWFQKGVQPVAARMDGPASVRALHFDSTKQYLYVVDSNTHRVLKYDYDNRKYIGWIGQYYSYGSVGISGSTISSGMASSCVATTNGNATPGWCLGGQATNNGNTAWGAMNYPQAVVDDGTYIYVANRNSHSVNRYNAATGAFDGWIGGVSSTPVGPATNGPASCASTSAGQPTPGWCLRGGSNQAYGNPQTGNGLMRYPRALAIDASYLYVASQGAILRYNLVDGSFAGWTGLVYTTSPTGNATGSSGCTARTNGQDTHGWCLGGTSYVTFNAKNTPGAINDPTGLLIIGSTLYVIHTDNSGTIATYNLNTGVYQGFLANLTYNWTNPFSAVADSNYIYIADYSRVIKIDLTGTVQGWMGKVLNPNSMSGNTGCSALSQNSNTPGWCLGGTSKYGMDETAFHQLTALELDSSGNLLTGQGDTFPAIKQFDSTSGTYNGTMSFISTSPKQWSNDATSVAGYYGFDDYSLFNPAGIFNDGTNLYVADFLAGRVKKMTTATGSLTGWIGAITSVPSGGISASCLAANPMGPAPAWCLGSYYQPNYMGSNFVSFASDGVFNTPAAITGDGTNIYVVDSNASRILKFNASTGAFIGWLGAIATSPTGNAPGVSGCVGAVTVTPGWCTGGGSTSGTGNGQMSNPSAITYTGGTIYVVDSNNQRVVSFDSSSGVYKGYIGRVASGTPTGCTVMSNGGVNVSLGWCKGGTNSANNPDRGGSFSFHTNGAWSRNGISTDGIYLYIANTYNYRIDRWGLNGQFQGATPTRTGTYTNTWINLIDPTSSTNSADANRATLSAATNNWGCDYPQGVWVDGANIYGITNSQCGSNVSVVWKLNQTTGTMAGWKAGIAFSSPPTGGDTGCAGATGVSPGWCQGGLAVIGFKLGYLTNNSSGITGDSNFIYVTDDNTHRITRLPK